ncbi:MAG: HAD family hydrolase [Bullifex sp.]
MRRASELKDLNVSLIISDVDDTITSKGRLLPEALSALYEAEEKGYRTILLSGGSAGWCEVYLRQWPVYMVIAESGAVLLYKDEEGQIRYRQNPAITPDDLKKRDELLRMIGEEHLSSDQYARLYDIAVDLSRVSERELEDIMDMAGRMGARMAKSSIHLNIWFGDYSKSKGLLSFMELCGIDRATLLSRSMYFGDAPNDDEMFALIPASVGMKSVEDRKSEFSHLPAYIASEYGGKGFSEAIKALKRLS